MNEEIIPSSKINEILELFKDNEIILHTNKEEKYKWLDSNHYSIQIKNDDNELFIDLEEEISLFFKDWHSHYYPNEEYYNFMIENVKDIINNKTYTFSIYQNDKWYGSKLNEKEIKTKEEAIKEVKGFFKNHKEFIDKLNEGITTIKCNYWNKKNNKEFEIKKHSFK